MKTVHPQLEARQNFAIAIGSYRAGVSVQRLAVERAVSDLHLLWRRPPARAHVELVR